MTDDDKNLAIEKLKLENEKLQCEIRELRRPFYMRPSFWVAAATAVFAIFGMLGQYTISSIRSEQATLNAEKAEKRVKNAKTLEKKSERKNKELIKNKFQLESELALMEEKLQKAQLAFKDTNRKIQDIEDSVPEEQRKLLEEVSYTIDTAQQAIPMARRVVSAESIVDRAIPDGNLNKISDIIELEQNGKVKSLSLQIDITHTWIGDLQVELESPSGKKIILFDRVGGSGDDLFRNFNMSSHPALKDLKGNEIRGQWILHVRDFGAMDTGRFNSWGIEIEEESFDVVLITSGTQKIQTIKAIRQATGLGLMSAKKLFDSIPIEIKQEASKEEAIRIKELLESIGASVEINPSKT